VPEINGANVSGSNQLVLESIDTVGVRSSILRSPTLNPPESGGFSHVQTIVGPRWGHASVGWRWIGPVRVWPRMGQQNFSGSLEGVGPARRRSSRPGNGAAGWVQPALVMVSSGKLSPGTGPVRCDWRGSEHQRDELGLTDALWPERRPEGPGWRPELDQAGAGGQPVGPIPDRRVCPSIDKSRSRASERIRWVPCSASTCAEGDRAVSSVRLVGVLDFGE
jgi:hypothetical protein